MRSLVAASLLTTACSLHQDGPNIGPTLDASPGQDAIVVMDAQSEPGPPLPCTSDASACVSALANGWTPIAFAQDRSTACPSNFTSTDVIANLQPQAGACTCDCMVTKQPSCAIGMLTGTFGDTNSCSGGSNSFNIAMEGQCYSWGGTFNVANYHNWNKLPITPGTCTSNATPNAAKVGRTEMRGCIPSAQCTEDVCNGMVPAGFASCIAHDGDLPCPGAPFTNKAATVGSDLQVGCGACAGCAATGTCGPATVDYYATSNCTSSLAQDKINGTCALTAMGVTNVGYIKYTSAVQNPVCNAGTSTPAPQLVMPRTICCRP